VGPYSQAIQKGNLIFLSGQIPLLPETGKLIEGDIQVQTAQCLKNLEAVLKAAGLGLNHIVKTTVFLTDLQSFALVNETYGQFFTQNPPARSCVEVSALPKGALLEIEAIACCD
ncbi:MAG: RidA family protein, partial [Clostridia bacterium]|nr:RidA family protein [Clostridia bacterium]